MSIGMEAEQSLRVSPSLIAFNEILELSSQELQELVRAELESNPALEMDERQVCPTCGSSYSGNICQRCLSDRAGKVSDNLNHSKTTSDEYAPSDDYYMGDESWGGGGNNNGEEEFDPMTIVAAEMGLPERLMMELQANLDEADFPIAEFLVGSLDERGYMSSQVSAIASTFSTDEARVERILSTLQMIAPPGVGARDLRECLLLQVKHLEENDPEVVIPTVVKPLIGRYLTELGEHKYGYIASQLGVSSEAINEAREFIKRYLNPFPAEGFASDLTGPSMRSGGPKTGYVVPDVIITDHEGEYEIEVVESKRFFLKLNSLYNRLASEGLNNSVADASDSDREHVRRYVSRARFFMSNINQRRETLQKITRCLVETQTEFLRDGIRELKPITRSMLASYIGVHESTVSRATAGKYVMLPSRKVVPFSDFFTANLSIKDVIKEIIEQEEKKGRGKPLTDQELVERLEERGIRLARRTVAKYRSQLKILPSTLR